MKLSKLIISGIILLSLSSCKASCSNVKNYAQNHYELNDLTLVGEEFTLLGETKRKLPQVKDGGLQYYPVYGQSFKDHSSLNESIILENNKLLPSEVTYDSLDKDGNLYLKGNIINQEFYLHSAASSLYGGLPSNNEKAVVKEINVYNPIKLGNYITGLYAPGGEVVKLEISESDLLKCGGEFEVYIGQISSRNVSNNIPTDRDFTRMPSVVSKFIIKNSTSYIGSYYGGPIYIMPKVQNTFKMKISGALEYLHYIDGVTSEDDFNRLLNTTSQFFDFEIYGQEVRFNGPRKDIYPVGEKQTLDYNNVKSIMSFWHQCNVLSRYMPHGANDLTSITMMFDTYIPMGSAVAIVGRDYALLPISWVNGSLNYKSFMKTGGWGTIHEFNHHFQKFGCNGNNNEVTNNVVNYMEYMLFTRITALRDYTNLSHGLGLDSHKGIEYYNEYLNTNTALNTERGYGLLLQNFGVDVFKKFARKQNGLTTLESFYDALSTTVNMDLSYLFKDLWHMDLSDELMNKYSSLPKYVPIGSYYASSFKIGNLEESNNALPYLCEEELDLDLKEDINTIEGYNVNIKSVSDITNGTLTHLGNNKYHYKASAEKKISEFKVTVTITKDNYKEDVVITIRLNPTKNDEFDYSLPNKFNLEEYVTLSKKVDTSKFKLTSPNFVPWDNSDELNLDKVFDGDINTYAHSQRNVIVNETNHITLNIEGDKVFSFNALDFVYKNNRQLPVDFKIYVSDDGNNYRLIKTVKDNQVSDGRSKVQFDEVIATKYIQIDVTKTTENYLAISDLELKTNISVVTVGNNNLSFYGNTELLYGESLYGHYYRLNKDSYLEGKFENVKDLFALMKVHSSSYEVYINDKKVDLKKVLELDKFDIYEYSNSDLKNVKIKILVKEGYIDIENIAFNR